MFELRDYQANAVDFIDAVMPEKQNILLELPTGAGKTIVMAEAIKRWVENYKDTRVLILAHTKELVHQNADKFLTHAQRPDDVGVFCASLNRREHDRPVVYGSVQSVARNLDKFADGFDVVMVDECHHVSLSGEGTYRKVLDHFREVRSHARLVGLTATPYRLGGGVIYGTDKKEPGRYLWNRVDHRVDLGELIERGFICKPVPKGTATKFDTSGLRKRAGEFVAADLDALMADEAKGASVVSEIVRRFTDDNRKRWLVFCANIEHAERTAQGLHAEGVATGVVHSAMKSDKRDEVLAQYASGDLVALCNVNVLSEGYDNPEIDGIAMLRPTLSPGLFYQQVGRGFRLHKDKSDCLVLDFVDNVPRHGPLDQIIPPQAPGGQGVPPMKECPECQSIIHAALMECPGCGHQFPAPERKKTEDRHRAPGEMQLIAGSLRKPKWLDVDGVTLYRHQKAGKPDSIRVTYRCGFDYIHEYLCPNHPHAFNRTHAQGWLAKRMPLNKVYVMVFDISDRAWDLDEFIAMSEELIHPNKILVEKDGRWLRIVDAAFPSESRCA